MDKIALNEKEYVEEPFLKQLERLGWTILRAGEVGKGDPSITYRDSFHEVIIEKELEEALKRINPWLADGQLPPILHELTVPPVSGFIESNRYILEKLLENTSTENHKTGKPETVRFIDFTNVNNNSFLAVSQFKVNIPGTEKHIIPDIVLFINGLPIVTIECKSAYLPDPMGEAITQLLRYQNRRGDDKEGNEKLFWYNQIVIGTSRQVCRYSSITGEFDHFTEWKDPYPFKLSDIDTEGSESITSQHVLVQGMLAKSNLLDIIQSFILFREGVKDNLIKIVARYQQYRTVLKIIERLRSGKSAKEKSGIVWHTQGSGKSLTMMFTVRKMYHEKQLSGYKTVFVTDRTDLEKQLKGTAKSIGFTVNVAHKIASLKGYLRTNTPDLVMGMIHKFQEHEIQQEFPVLNTSEKILVMVDEAHRTQYKWLGANLAKSLPNAVRIAYTGTPIDKTEKTFGDYIDKYSIRQAVDDGVTVRIIYEGRTHGAEISDREAVSKRFDDVFIKVEEETKKDILNRYAWKAYLEAEETIKEKARDMLEHYVAHIFPNNFKAQVVAVSREAAIRYKKAFDELLNDKDWLEDYTSNLEEKNQAKINIGQLAKLKAEVVISGSPNDEPEMYQYTDKSKHDNVIASFLLPFSKTAADGTTGDVGIIVIQSMLLTGFDAPLEQVMYLDDIIREHTLLQAIARVNRMEKNKYCGFVVDYVGVTRHLRRALANFEAKDTDEILQVVADLSREIDELNHTRAELVSFFKKFDIVELNDVDACVDALADEETRNDFSALFYNFTKAMDKVLPDPEALKFAYDLRLFSFIVEAARNRYRDEKLSIKDASKKIRDIVDEFLISKGIDPKIPPLPIFSEKFKIKVADTKSAKAKTEELKNAIAEYTKSHQEEDPELYERLGEKLEKLLKEYRENWESLSKELQNLIEEIREGREGEDNYGLDPQSDLPFLGLLKKEVFGVKDLSELDILEVDLLVQTTKDIVGRVKDDIQLVDFWNNLPAQKRLKGFIASHLLTEFKGNSGIFNKRTAIAQRIMELAFHISERLGYGKS